MNYYKRIIEVLSEGLSTGKSASKTAERVQKFEKEKAFAPGNLKYRKPHANDTQIHWKGGPLDMGKYNAKKERIHKRVINRGKTEKGRKYRAKEWNRGASKK